MDRFRPRKRPGTRWTSEEDARLRQLLRYQTSLAFIAGDLHRTPQDTIERARRLVSGLPMPIIHFANQDDQMGPPPRADTPPIEAETDPK